ncbi:MAG: LysR family transcriptional regulator [bacterium]
MNIAQLETFCAVADKKSFIKAAEVVHRTQPTASAQIQDGKVAEFQGDMGPFQRYLRPSKFAIIDDVIARLASEATKGKETILEKARAIYNYVLEKMDYDKEIPGWGHGDGPRVCLAIRDGKIGTGNCTDFHSR